jgi:hypothetical protein
VPLDARPLEAIPEAETTMLESPALTSESRFGTSHGVDRYPADLSAAHAAAPIRPDRLSVWPTEDGSFGIDVRWYGRECILRAVVVRRVLSDAGYPATVGNSVDGRHWDLTVGPVPADAVAGVIENYIW